MNIRAPRTFCKYNRLHVPSPSHLQHYLSLFEVEEKAVEDWEELEQIAGLFAVMPADVILEITL
jgi:hypothetical protein